MAKRPINRKRDPSVPDVSSEDVFVDDLADLVGVDLGRLFCGTIAVGTRNRKHVTVLNRRTDVTKGRESEKGRGKGIGERKEREKGNRESLT